MAEQAYREIYEKVDKNIFSGPSPKKYRSGSENQYFAEDMNDRTLKSEEKYSASMMMRSMI